MSANLTYISETVCRRLVDIDQVVRRIEEVYRWEAEGRILYPTPAVIRVMQPQLNFKSHMKVVLIPPLDVAGYRIVSYRLEADGSGPSSANSTRLIALVDLKTGTPLALVDEHYNYTLRTAASVAVAARRLHPPAPRLGLIGAGGVARAVARVFTAILPLEAIDVTSRKEASRKALVEEITPQLSIPVRAVDSIEDVLRHCNVIVTATTTKTPLIQYKDVPRGALLCALGSFELEPEIYRKADKVLVDDWNQTRNAHDMKELVEKGLFDRAGLYSELSAMVAGQVPGRESDHELIVVRTEGMASQDVALAHWAYQEASRRNLDSPIGISKS